MTAPEWVPAVGEPPTGVLMVGLVLLGLVALPVARRRAYQAGVRSVRLVDDRGRAERAKDRMLLVAAMVPAVGFWAAVLAGSFRGLTAFGRDTLDWTDGSEFLVPATLDGVAVGFAVLAFRAVRKGRSPDRANRVVWGSAVASACINFVHEFGRGQDGSIVGGAYLALLSLFGMVMFHEFLDQFEQGADQPVRRQNPRFGARWITSPPNTLCAAIAWRNHPPADGTPATVRAALDHLDAVRATKLARREADQLADHQRAVDAERRRVELATAKAQQPTDHADRESSAESDQEPDDKQADEAEEPDRKPRPRAVRKSTKGRPLRVVKDPTNHSPAAIANARLLRERYGGQLPTDRSDRQIRDEMGWSYERVSPALAAYRAGADRESADDQESDRVEATA